MEWHLEYSLSFRHSGVQIIVQEGLSFDAPASLELNRARQIFIQDLLLQIRMQVALRNALDVGCGVGYLSSFLHGLGFEVVGIDGRNDNTIEAKKRFPGITFLTADAENLPNELGLSDFVLCAGLLYHLENPFRVVRNLHALTGKVLLIEGMCAPGTTAMMELLNEGSTEDQGLNYVAFYPTESCLINMLYRSGFPYVYQFQRLPEHELYRRSIRRKRERTMLVASKLPLTLPSLILAQEQVRPVVGLSDPWTTNMIRARYFVGRLRRSLLKSLFRAKEQRPS